MRIFTFSVLIAISFCSVGFSKTLTEPEVLQAIEAIDGKYNQAEVLDSQISDVYPILIEYINAHPEDYMRSTLLIKKLVANNIDKAIPAVMSFITKNQSVLDVAEEIDSLVPYTEKIIPYLIDFLNIASVRNSQQDKARLRAIQVIQKIPDKRAVSILLTYLDDKSEFVGYAAALALGNIKSRKALEPLLQVLKTSPSSLVKIGAAQGLGMLGRNDGFTLCEGILANPRHGWRGAAVTALSKIEHPRRMELILSALNDNWDIGGRYAVDALAEIGTEKEIPVLEELQKKNTETTTEPWKNEKIKSAIKAIRERTTKSK